MTTVLFVGDSITVGIVGYPSVVDGSSFRRKAQASMGWTSTGPFKDPNGLFHGGVGGTTTSDFLSGHAQWVSAPTDDQTWMRQFKPDLVIEMLGVNDIISNPSSPNVAGIVDRQAQLFNSAAALYPQAALFAASIVEAGPDWFSIAAHAYNALLKAHANHTDAKSKFPGGVRFLDACALYNQAFWNEGTTKNLTVDGTHPNQRGYDLIAAGIVQGMSAGAVAPMSTAQQVLAAGLLAGAGFGLGRWMKWW